MAYRNEKTPSGTTDLIIDGWENGIALSPYKGIANIRNLNTSWYPGVAYLNYRRQAATLGAGTFFAGVHSTNVSNNVGWVFTAQSSTSTMGVPVQEATSPVGLNYILDANGVIFKQSAVGSSTFNVLQAGGNKFSNGSKGLGFFNNYLVVIGTSTIEFCGDGTGDSTIISSNWNKVSGTATRTQAVTFNTNTSTTTLQVITPVTTNVQYPVNFNLGDAVQFTTTGTLPGGLSTTSTYYITSITTGNPNTFQISNSISDVAVTLNSSLGSSATSATLASVWSESTGVYGVLFDNGDTRKVLFTNGSTAISWITGLSTSTTTFFISVYIQVTSSGTGTQTLVDLSSPLPVGNCTSFQYTGMQNGATTLTITSYIDPTGKTVNTYWQGATGQYNIVDPAGHNILATFTTGSSSVSLLSPITEPSFGTTSQIQVVNPSATKNRIYISKVDGNLYFANGRSLGRVLSENLNTVFNPADTITYIVDYAATQLLKQTDSIVDMADLKSTLILAGNKDTYAWDYVSATPQAPAPVGEQIVRIINILNNIYILAGQKGNTYVSNGYSAQILFKLPDFVAGVIDPVWSFGGAMFHRGKLWFQALATSNSSSLLLSGIFSLNVSATFLQQESATGLVMEAQNSFGLVPSTSTGIGILIDNQDYATTDNYYSVWGCGAASTGGIDYNDSSVWQNFEAVIETDMIPTGTNLARITYENIEYKLDRPLATGDQVRLSYRTSLIASYTVEGTSTSSTASLSDTFNSNINTSEWVQFKVELSGASSSSSFVPLREIRLHQRK